MTPEFSRPERVDAIGERERMIEIAAAEPERVALARRFGLVAIDSLDARLTVRREAAGIVAEGRVTARVTQACSVTGDPIDVTIDEPVRLLFVDALVEAEESELDTADMDTLEIENGAIDLGEAAAETMALALDPFPRGPGAAAALKAAGVIDEDEVATGPFAGLKAQLERKR